MVNYAQSITDAYRCHVGGSVPVRPIYHGREHLDAVLAKGRGAVVVTGHLGAWQLGPYFLTNDGYRPLTVAMAREPNAGLQRFMETFQRPFSIVYTNAETFGTFALKKTLEQNGIVAMQVDRPLGNAFVELPFVGGRARFATGPAALARSTGAALVPSFLIMGSDATVRVSVEEPIVVRQTADRAKDLEEATAKIVAAFEKHATAAPLQWFNFYDFWLDEGAHDGEARVR